jgi:GTPase
VWDVVAGEIFRLGLGEPIPVSAEHGEGLVDLHDALLPFASVESSESPDAVNASTSAASGRFSPHSRSVLL